LKKGLRIASVAHHGCIRVLKQAIALQKQGHKVFLISEQVPYGYTRFDMTAVYKGPENLKSVLNNLDFDLIHVHNEPDWMVPICKEVANGKPVIYDIHDLEHLRWLSIAQKPGEDETKAFEAADALVHVSKSCKFAAERYHGDSKPNIVLYSFENEEFLARDIDLDFTPNWKSLCYEGGLDTKAPVQKEDGRATINLRNLVPIAKAFREQNYMVHFYSANPLSDRAYEMLGCYVAAPVIYTAMLQGLRPHGLGFVGGALSTALLEFCMPNKLFEYMSQGVTPVSLFASEVGIFLKEYDCGIALDGLQDLDRQLEDLPKKRKNVLTVRKELTMEKQIHKLEDLYQEVL